MKLTDKAKGYLFWGAIWMLAASMGQIFTYALFHSNQILLTVVSAYDWIACGILTHIWARD